MLHVQSQMHACHNDFCSAEWDRAKDKTWPRCRKTTGVAKPLKASHWSNEDYVKKGQPPSMPGSNRRPGGRRNISTSDPLANWGRRVSNLVDTTTVLERWGSVCSIKVSMVPCNFGCIGAAMPATCRFCCLVMAAVPCLAHQHGFHLTLRFSNKLGSRLSPIKAVMLVGMSLLLT